MLDRSEGFQAHSSTHGVLLVSSLGATLTLLFVVDTGTVADSLIVELRWSRLSRCCSSPCDAAERVRAVSARGARIPVREAELRIGVLEEDVDPRPPIQYELHGEHTTGGRQHLPEYCSTVN